ncbi:hypothetical protein PGTUg99_023445 [Puccinia graminis f. sp. tritici]|uniref:Uncharacterized protein n=1 Tax=Puccinia graminis f. sp. tritici TaxID=56615 RepID=A0A5B0SJP5_PUCGR|nr:hypothetical protein PGTUg99_023445 [Puccinia graminis f. sp. tritici]
MPSLVRSPTTSRLSHDSQGRQNLSTKMPKLKSSTRNQFLFLQVKDLILRETSRTY